MTGKTMAILKIKTDCIQTYVFDRYLLEITKEDFIGLSLFFNNDIICQIELRDKDLSDLFMDDLSDLLDLALINKEIFQISYDKQRHYIKIYFNKEQMKQYTGNIIYAPDGSIC